VWGRGSIPAAVLTKGRVSDWVTGDFGRLGKGLEFRLRAFRLSLAARIVEDSDEPKVGRVVIAGATDLA
jgi:hypothetical protein